MTNNLLACKWAAIDYSGIDLRGCSFSSLPYHLPNAARAIGMNPSQSNPVHFVTHTDKTRLTLWRAEFNPQTSFWVTASIVHRLSVQLLHSMKRRLLYTKPYSSMAHT